MKTSFWRLRTRTIHHHRHQWRLMECHARLSSLINWRWDNKRKELLHLNKLLGAKKLESSLARRELGIRHLCIFVFKKTLDGWSMIVFTYTYFNTLTRTCDKIILRSKQNVEEIEIITITRGPGLGHHQDNTIGVGSWNVNLYKSWANEWIWLWFNLLGHLISWCHFLWTILRVHNLMSTVRVQYGKHESKCSKASNGYTDVPTKCWHLTFAK